MRITVADFFADPGVKCGCRQVLFIL